jgi:predicted metal-dependent HD superfamily phosphohydrolase
VKKEKREEILFDLTFRYQGEGRYYHNMEHIQYMLNFLESQKEKIIDKEAVFYATWFHDSVYDVTSNTNEEDSAELCRRELEHAGVSKETIEHAVNLILATKTHIPIEGDEDSKIFLDADLVSLAQPTEEYNRNIRNIRKEYFIYSDDVYREGRIKVLESFLTKERIFQTEEAYRKHEKKARENIKREIQMLKGDII